jgi:hypothetical protein
MKKAFTLLLLSFFICLIRLCAQSYLCIDTLQTRYYYGDHWWSEVKAIRIDSVKLTGDYKFYKNFTTVRDVADPCVDLNGPSWIGSGVFAKNGLNIFLNDENDSIKIITNATLGQSWVLYRFPNGDYFNATLTNKSLESFCGIYDSVKSITIQCKNSANQNISHDLNGFIFKISKQNGLIRLLEFYDFPNNSIVYYLSMDHILSTAEVYDWEVGDEFHFSELTTNNGSFLGSVFTKRIVINKNPGISYLCHEYKSETNSNYQTTISDYDTTFPAGSSLQLVTYLLPEQTPSTVILKHDTSDCLIGSQVIVGNFNYTWSISDSCWEHFFEPPQANTRKFIKGIGDLWNHDDPVHWYASSNKLVYYKKGSLTCGTPLGISEFLVNNKAVINISPNPFTTTTQITLPQTYHNIALAVYDIQGKLLAQQQHADCSKIQFNRNQLSNGLYFLKLTLDDKEVETGKIVISE